MNQQKLLVLAGCAALALGAGIWLSVHRAGEQQIGGTKMFPDLQAALGEVQEVRFSRGDGSKTSLRRAADAWQVAERDYPADAAKVRELLLGLSDMRIIEHKTRDPANYSQLGVEAPESPTATSTLVEVVAPQKTWSLLVGKNAGGKSLYVRKPDDAVSAQVEPIVVVDPDQKRWLDRQLIDLPANAIHEIAVQPESGPPYLLTRAARGDESLVLSPVPAGRKPADGMTLNAQADALTAFHFDEVQAKPAEAAAPTSRATFKTFDGAIIDIAGRKDGTRTLITVSAREDAALAAKFAPTAAGAPAEPAPAPAAAAKQPAVNAARLQERGARVEYEIPAYKYDALFKPQAELLEAPAAAAKK